MGKIQSKFAKVLYFLFPFVFIALLLELTIDFGVISSKVIPAPSSLFLTLYQKTVVDPVLFTHLYGSFYRLIIGYGLGVLVGILVGILIGINKTVHDFIHPILSLLVSVPTLAWVPLLLILIGIGDETVIVAIFLGSFFPIVYNTMNGIRGIEKQLIWASQTMGADKMTIFFEVLLPGSLVSIITGLRLAIGYSWRALVGAEMLAAGISWGVGHAIYVARAFHDVQMMFVGLLIIALGGFLMDRLIMSPVEKRTIERWGLVKER